ncbi:phosphotransferase [Thalassotalea maritima]|uniref:phosphotransferase n=1 Tax=Thalassotalea maritima TaxID=3242416 RepID=UPI003527B1DE
MRNSLQWDSPEWIESAQTWVNENLKQRGVEPVGNLTKVSGWALGQIFKQNTKDGFYFFKATAFLPLFSNESLLCLKLAELTPEYVPNTICCSESEQWMISRDFGGGLPEGADITLWVEAFKTFAQLQKLSFNHINELIENGCLQREIHDIPKQLDEILSDNGIVRHLPEQFKIKRREIIFKVKQSVEALAKFNIPNTLVHGDLHIENIAKIGDRFLFFDWSDACISHPFIDGTYIFRMPEGKDKDIIVNTYLSQWSNLYKLEDLKSAWKQAELVCYTHQAISYASMKRALSNVQMQDLGQAFTNAFNRLLAS